MPDDKSTPDLWMRMAALDECCHVSMNSVQISEAGGGAHREWEVSIRHKGTGEIIYAKHRSAALAIEQAVEIGVRRTRRNIGRLHLAVQEVVDLLMEHQRQPRDAQ